MLSIGAAQFKPNISPTVIDQSPHKIAHVITEKSGERVIVDPEESVNSVMLWFYLLINIGACFGIPTTYLAKLVGYWAAYLIPTILYLLLPPLLWYLNPRLVKQPPGGSDLGNVFRVLEDVFAHGGLKKIGRKGFWDTGKPSVRKAAGSTKVYTYDDAFVNDVRRTFQACGIFLFIPIWQINDGGLGAAANALSAGMDTDGAPNDLLDNLNSVSIVLSEYSASLKEKTKECSSNEYHSGPLYEPCHLPAPSKTWCPLGSYLPNDLWFRARHGWVHWVLRSAVLRLQDVALWLERHYVCRYRPRG